jgi:hypothetical protein
VYLLISRNFLVPSKPVSEYDILLGQDDVTDVCAEVRLSNTSCSLEIGEDPANLVARLAQPIRHSQAVSVAHRINVATRQHALPAVAPVATSCTEVSSHNRYKALLNRILKERRVAYSLKFAPKNEHNPTMRDVPGEVQSVIDKYSKPGGV